MFFNSPRPGGCGRADLYVTRRKNKRDNFGWQTPGELLKLNQLSPDPSTLDRISEGQMNLFRKGLS